MICAECKRDGLTSMVYPGMCMVTAMYFQPFYDEAGKFHNHDRNIRTISYSCSNDHKWQEDSSGSCWCGWRN